MTKLELQAIRTLPPRFVADGTHVCEVSNMQTGKWVVAINPKHAPIIYWGKKIGWKKLRLTSGETRIPEIIRFP